MLYFSTQDVPIAAQVAELLNRNNRLQGFRTAGAILHGETDYLIEVLQGVVWGAVGIERQSFQLTEIKHLTVRPEMRRRGVGEYLVGQALTRCTTPLVYATVRQDNHASLRVFQKHLFVPSQSYLTPDGGQIQLLVRSLPLAP